MNCKRGPGNFTKFDQPGIKRRHVGINGFVVGHSRLSYLRQFPIDTLKTDKPLVSDKVTGAGVASLSAA